MSEFVGHGECPQCHGSDPLATYDDGHVYCFSCGYYKDGSIFKKIELLTKSKESDSTFPCPILPMDAQPLYNKFTGIDSSGLYSNCLAWLKKHEITSTDASRYRFMWSDSMEALILPVYDKLGGLRFWQARHFHPKARNKYTTHGRKDDYDMIIEPSYTKSLAQKAIVLVEGYLDAVKVGRHAPAIPLFGSEISIARKCRLTRDYKHVILWLDADKYFHAMTWRKENLPWFEEITVLKTAMDPKALTDGMILNRLQGIA